MSHWKQDDIPDQTGRVAIVTGANTGIGYETARILAGKGAAVTLACRNATKADGAVERILAERPAGRAATGLLDLADLASVESFARTWREANDRLDLLILNAGVMVPPASTTAQGFELQFGVNHLGHFALTGHLLDLLRSTPGSRVVVVSSTAARGGAMNFDDLQYTARGYRPWPAYSQSKLANQLFARELQRRLHADGSDVLVTAAHPGWTGTELQRHSGVFRLLNPLMSMKPLQGSLPTLRAATDPDAGAAAYFGPHGIGQVRGYPVEVPMVPAALDDEAAGRLWEVSCELSGVSYLPNGG